MDLAELKRIVEWIPLAQCGNLWRAVCKKVTKLRVC
jgi:hypothetical protein